jgi:hypothetical protein
MSPPRVTHWENGNNVIAPAEFPEAEMHRQMSFNGFRYICGPECTGNVYQDGAMIPSAAASALRMQSGMPMPR